MNFPIDCVVCLLLFITCLVCAFCSSNLASVSFFAEAYRYFLNKERCETGGIRSVASWLDPAPTEPKVNVLAVNSNCTKVYFHSRKVGEWFEYEDKQVDDIICHPRR